MRKFTVFGLSFILTLGLPSFSQKVLAPYESFQWVSFRQNDFGMSTVPRTGNDDTATIVKEVPPLTETPTPTPIPTPTPTPTPRPTPTPIPTPISTITPTTSSDEKKTYIINAINEYRVARGLSQVQMDSYTCDFAKLRAGEIAINFSHDEFENKINNDSLPYPSYSAITENLAMNSDYKDVVVSWINSAGHRENIERDTPYVCVESSGNYYAYEGWKP